MARMVPLSLAVLGLVLLAPAHTRAQDPKPPTPEEVAAAEKAPLFSSHETVQLTLEADFRAIRREDRAQDSQERPAVLRWQDASGSEASLEIQLRTRGNFRLAKRNCDWPPLRINIKKSDTAGTLFENQDKLKLVGICKAGQSYWEQYVLLEYLAYRTFSLFTPLGFRVRLARVTYVDTGGEESPFTRYGFLIEDDAHMAARNGGWKVDWVAGRQLSPRETDPEHSVLTDVFQYFIGNTDWSALQMHNMELVQFEARKLSPVPYDFDFSGIVDARYAVPDSALPIRTVRQRHFRGFCPAEFNRDPTLYESIYQRFRDKREEIYALWLEQEGLEQETIKDTREYLDEFYDILSDPRRIESRMMKDCRRMNLGR